MVHERRDLRPLVAAAAAAVLSLGLLAAAVVGGWLGPDVGRGDGFCEAARDALVLQPANSWSNLGFVIAGLAVAWRAGRPEGRLWPHPWLATILAVVIVLLGPASMAMHATQSALGGHLDLLSMYLIAGFAAAYAVMRVTRRGLGTFAVTYLAAVLICELVESADVRVPGVMTGANLTFGIFLVIAAVGEWILLRRKEIHRDNRWGYASVGTLVLAFVIWSFAKTGNAFCHPDTLLQGHAAWHLLDALAAWFLYRLYANEIPTAGAGQTR